MVARKDSQDLNLFIQRILLLQTRVVSSNFSFYFGLLISVFSLFSSYSNKSFFDISILSIYQTLFGIVNFLLPLLCRVISTQMNNSTQEQYFRAFRDLWFSLSLLFSFLYYWGIYYVNQLSFEVMYNILNK